MVFDQNLGDLFVVRTAGNLIDDHGLGSIEHAVNHLGTRLIVVLGHSRCGAVKAALEGPTAPGHVNSLVRDIQPAVAAAKTEKGDPLANTVKANARLVAEKIRKEAKLGEHKSEVRIVSGYYDLDTGTVEWIDVPQVAPEKKNPAAEPLGLEETAPHAESPWSQVVDGLQARIVLKWTEVSYGTPGNET